MATLANGLKTIELGATLWRVLLNDNFAKLTPGLTGLYSARPAANAASGRFYFATDSGINYYSNGTAWSIVSAPPYTFTHAGSEGVSFSITVTPNDARIYRRVNVIRTSDGLDITSGVTITLTLNTVNVNLGSTDFAVKVLYETY